MGSPILLLTFLHCNIRQSLLRYCTDEFFYGRDRFLFHHGDIHGVASGEGGGGGGGEVHAGSVSVSDTHPYGT